MGNERALVDFTETKTSEWFLNEWQMTEGGFSVDYEEACIGSVFCYLYRLVLHRYKRGVDAWCPALQGLFFLFCFFLMSIASKLRQLAETCGCIGYF